MKINHGAARLWMLLGSPGNAGGEAMAFNSSLAPFILSQQSSWPQPPIGSNRPAKTLNKKQEKPLW